MDVNHTNLINTDAATNGLTATVTTTATATAMTKTLNPMLMDVNGVNNAPATSLIRYVVREPKPQDIIVLSDDEDEDQTNAAGGGPLKRRRKWKRTGTQSHPITLMDSDDEQEDDVIFVESSAQWLQQMDNQQLKVDPAVQQQQQQSLLSAPLANTADSVNEVNHEQNSHSFAYGYPPPPPSPPGTASMETKNHTVPTQATNPSFDDAPPKNISEVDHDTAATYMNTDSMYTAYDPPLMDTLVMAMDVDNDGAMSDTSNTSTMSYTTAKMNGPFSPEHIPFEANTADDTNDTLAPITNINALGDAPNITNNNVEEKDATLMDISQSFMDTSLGTMITAVYDTTGFADTTNAMEVDNDPSQDIELIANAQNPPTIVHTYIPPNTSNIELIRAMDMFVQSLDLADAEDTTAEQSAHRSLRSSSRRSTRKGNLTQSSQQPRPSPSPIPSGASSSSMSSTPTLHNLNSTAHTTTPHDSSNTTAQPPFLSPYTVQLIEKQISLLNTSKNKPYVPTRVFYNSTWEDWAQLEAGDILHYPFTASEIETLIYYQQRHNIKLARTGVHKWDFVAEHLPGRTPLACKCFYRDYTDGIHQTFQQVIMIKKRIAPLRQRSNYAWVQERTLTGRMRTTLTKKYCWMNMTKEEKIDGGSGDVIALAIFNNPTKGLKIAAGSVCDENPEYNMPGNLRLWELKTASFKTLKGHQSIGHSGEPIWRTVTDVKASKDRTLLFSASHDGSANIWKARSGRLRSTLKFHSKPINQIAINYSTDDNVMATCSNDGTATVWTVDRKGKSGSGVICELKNSVDFDPRVDCVEFGHHETNNTLFLGVSTGNIDHPGYVEGYDIITGKSKMRFQDMQGSVSTLAVSSDGRIVASGNYSRYDNLSGDKHLHLHDARLQRSPLKFLTNHADVNVVSISPCDKYVASGNADKIDGQVVLFDIRKPNKKLYTFKHDQSVLNQSLIAPDTSVGIGGLHWMADSRTVITGGGDLMVKVWDVCTGNLLKSYATSNCVTSLAVDEDNNMIAAGVSGADGIVHVWTP